MPKLTTEIEDKIGRPFPCECHAPDRDVHVLLPWLNISHFKNVEVDQIEVGLASQEDVEKCPIYRAGFRMRVRHHQNENRYIFGIKSASDLDSTSDKDTLHIRYEWEQAIEISPENYAGFARRITDSLSALLKDQASQSDEQNSFGEWFETYGNASVHDKKTFAYNLAQEILTPSMKQHPSFEMQWMILDPAKRLEQEQYGHLAQSFLNPYNKPCMIRRVAAIMQALRYEAMEHMVKSYPVEIIPDDHEKKLKRLIGKGGLPIKSYGRSVSRRCFRVIRYKGNEIEIASDVTTVRVGSIQLANAEVELEVALKGGKKKSLKKKTVKNICDKSKLILEELRDILLDDWKSRGLKPFRSQSKGTLMRRAARWNSRVGETLMLVGCGGNFFPKPPAPFGPRRDFP